MVRTKMGRQMMRNDAREAQCPFRRIHFGIARRTQAGGQGQ
jgi:hypothetical protein